MYIVILHLKINKKQTEETMTIVTIIIVFCYIVK